MTTALNATVIHREELHHGLLILRVKPDGGTPAFLPGQYAVLGLPAEAARHECAEPEASTAFKPGKIIKRAYSIASSSLEGEYLEFYVAMVYSGALTPRLFALEEGDRIWLGRKITGMFTLADVTPGHDLIFVATGTGLAPYVSMLRSAYRFGGGFQTLVLHGARHSWDLGYRRELEALAAHYHDLHYYPMISRPVDDPYWQGETGYVSKFFANGRLGSLLDHDLDPTRTSVFLCGNPRMILDMEEALGARGFKLHSRRERGNVFSEKYWNESEVGAIQGELRPSLSS